MLPSIILSITMCGPFKIILLFFCLELFPSIKTKTVRGLDGQEVQRYKLTQSKQILMSDLFNSLEHMIRHVKNVESRIHWYV